MRGRPRFANSDHVYNNRKEGRHRNKRNLRESESPAVGVTDGFLVIITLIGPHGTLQFLYVKVYGAERPPAFRENARLPFMTPLRSESRQAVKAEVSLCRLIVPPV